MSRLADDEHSILLSEVQSGRWDWVGEMVQLLPVLGLVMGFGAPRRRSWWCRVGLRWGYCIGGMLNLILNGLLSTTHEGTLMCIVIIDLA